MPPIRPSCDLRWMQRALTLAAGMRGHVWPNPPVGCVIARDDDLIAEAATDPGGRPHAERKALELAGSAAAGSTLYVTLEPCCHWGKTPPCADAIIAARVSRVVCAIQDPDPRVNGGGFARLRAAGVDVEVGLGAEEARTLMSGFFHRVETGMPEVVVLERAPVAIPAGIDAVIRSDRDRATLITRNETKAESFRLAEPPGHGLPTRLGEMGLTTVAVAADDPIAHQLLVPPFPGTRV